MGTVVDDAASVEFHAFFDRHYAELSRLAHLLTGEADAADDLAADALLALWHRWDRVRAADHPVAYARGVVANLARTKIRSAVRERRRIALFWSQREEKTENPDVAGVVDVQEALRRL
ncbi:MAG: SigE family RNA polymerase sigma factor, partial [Streptomyces sp.]|nr:SigE family RNA polymerase sigma factor [Streptomyces sp.]